MSCTDSVRWRKDDDTITTKPFDTLRHVIWLSRLESLRNAVVYHTADRLDDAVFLIVAEANQKRLLPTF